MPAALVEWYRGPRNSALLDYDVPNGGSPRARLSPGPGLQGSLVNEDDLTVFNRLTLLRGRTCLFDGLLETSC